MTLVEKIKNKTNDGDNITLPAHEFADALVFWAEGIRTRKEITAFFALDDTDGNDKNQLDLIANHYQNLSDADKKLFPDIVERGLRGLQSGLLSDSEFASYIGLS
jgi:hypothetical protein